MTSAGHIKSGESEASSISTSTGIAVIGMMCRVPGADDPRSLWRNVREGRESIQVLGRGELDAAGVPAAAYGDPAYVAAYGGIDDFDCFDAAFFGVARREALQMDPQQRIFLEGAWHALEDAGYSSDRHVNAIGVFAGAGPTRYFERVVSDVDVDDPAGAFEALIRNDKDFLATRVAYKLDLRGPALTIQTACSTSLVAVHIACQSLLVGDCDMALAGAVSLASFKREGYRYQPGMVLSQDGHCRPFDRRASGTVSASGLAIVVLKRLRDAIRDRDNIRAVILGSAINNDGAGKVGYTAPSGEGQYRAIVEALGVSGIDPASIGYVEAHGTGTLLGDPIEFEALTRAYRQFTKRVGNTAIGSVKANVGHLDPAAGAVGLIKAALIVESGEIPPQVNFDEPNPAFKIEESPFYVSKEIRSFAGELEPRRAAVSSFGIGGTNAHVIVEQSTVVRTRQAVSSRPVEIFAISARTESDLDVVAERIAAHLDAHADESLQDVAYTLQVGRKSFPHRRLVLASNRNEAAARLGAPDGVTSFSSFTRSDDRPVVLMLSGHGGERIGLGRSLYEGEPVFRAQLDECARTAKKWLGEDIRDVFYPAPAMLSQAESRLALNSHTQAMLFSLEYSLAKLWFSWGIRPCGMIAHSSGEYVAACLAGVLSLEDAIALSVTRGKLIEQFARGRMMIVTCPAKEIAPRLPRYISIAAINSPRQCVLSGHAEDMALLQASLAADGGETRMLDTPYAGHSSLMESVADRIGVVAQSMAFASPSIPYISNVTGTWITDGEAQDPWYWARHTRNTVRFSEGVVELLRWQPDAVFLEIGPGRALANSVRAHEAAHRAVVLSSLADETIAPHPTYAALGKGWLAGVTIDWEGFNAPHRPHRTSLPGYPFRRERHWLETGRTTRSTVAGPEKRVGDWLYAPTWQRVELKDTEVSATLNSGVLILTSAGETECQITRALRGRYPDALIVAPGETFARLDERSYRIRSNDAGDFARLFEIMRTMDAREWVIVHAWSIGSSMPSDDPIDSFDSLIALAQALGRTTRRSIVHLIIVSSGMHKITEQDHPRLSNALLLGPARTIPREYQNIRVSSIDVNFADIGTLGPLLGDLIASFGEATPNAKTLALRAGGLLELNYRHVELPATPGVPALLRSGGTYVITGGTEGIGAAIATYLAESIRPNLVLVQRSGFPPPELRAVWKQIFGDADAVSRRVILVEQLQRLGANVVVVEADVSLSEGAAKVATVTSKRFGAVHGLIHAAGIPAGGLIQNKNLCDIRRTLAPKVRGTNHLRAAFAASPYDFLLLFSSISSVIGHAGQVDHCAANAYLDAIATSTANTPDRVLAINWDRWGEVGAGARASAGESLASLRGQVEFVPLLDDNFDFCRRSSAPPEWRFVTSVDRTANTATALQLSGGDHAAIGGLVHGLAIAAVRAATGNDGVVEACSIVDCGATPAAFVETILTPMPATLAFRIVLHFTNCAAAPIELAHGRVAGVHAGEVKIDADGHSSPARSSASPAYDAPTIDVASGIEIFRRALHSPRPQLVVSTRDLAARLRDGDMALVDAASPNRLTARLPLGSAALGAPGGDEIERSVATTFERLLGPDQVRRHDNFFELGGTSLTAVRLVHALGTELQVDLLASIVAEHPTVASLADYIRSKQAQRTTSDAAQRHSPDQTLVKLRTASHPEQPRLYLVHPAGGTVICYRDLAACLDIDCDVFGIQAGQPDGALAPDIETMAGTYLAAIRAVHRGGPLHIGGASFGGAVAFEIAKRVSSDGGELGSLILIDTPGPGQRWRNPADIEVFAYLLGLQICFPFPSSELAELPLERKLGLLLELTRQSRQEDLLPPYDQLLKVWNTCTANAKALWNYKIQQHHLPITYFLADERDAYTPTDPTIEWRCHALARFDLHRVQGNHITMLQSPNVAPVASVVSKMLDARSTQRLGSMGAAGER